VTDFYATRDKSRTRLEGRIEVHDGDSLKARPSWLVIENEMKLNKIEFMCACITARGKVRGDKNKAAVGDSTRRRRKRFLSLSSVAKVDGRGEKSETHAIDSIVAARSRFTRR
jgi:hypothetical protein